MAELWTSLNQASQAWEVEHGTGPDADRWHAVLMKTAAMAAAYEAMKDNE